MKLGSLFDGSGGFPLAGAINEIEPVWASEIEPYPMRVTALRFPGMKQLGDVRMIDGAKIEPVDVITFGSPCQDLSVAGRQAGIHEGTRSSLFFEAIRVIREMQDATAAEFPRWAVWENVPGALSSNSGQDFKAVLEALCGVRGGADVSVPEPPQARWAHAGCVVGDGYSLAWRLYDAQYWGVPQRRKRVYLIADFGAERAGEILFERDGLPGDHEPGRASRESPATDSEGSAGRSDSAKCLNPWDVQSKHVMHPAGVSEPLYCGDSRYGGGEAYVLDKAPTKDDHVHCPTPWDVQSKRQYSTDGVDRALDAGQGQGGQAHGVVYSLKGNFIDRETRQNGIGWTDGANYTLDATDRHGVVYDARGNGDGAVSPTITGDHNNRVTDYTAVCCQNTGQGWWNQSDIAQTLRTPTSGDGIKANLVVREALAIGNGQPNNMAMRSISNTLDTMHDAQAVMYPADLKARKYIVRRLTPLECCRLQGFPDWWEDGAEGSDTARYRMWGNGIALPCAIDVLGRVARAARAEERNRQEGGRENGQQKNRPLIGHDTD